MLPKVNQQVTRSNQDWVNGIKSSDRQIAQELFEQIDSWSKAFARKREQDMLFAEDVTQEALQRIVKSIDKYRDLSEFLHWCSVITHHEGLRKLKALKRSPVELPETLFGDDPTPAVETSIAISRHLAPCLNKLKPERKEVIVLLYFHDLSPSEVAQQLGVSQDNVNVRSYRARVDLRECLKAQGITKSDDILQGFLDVESKVG